MKTFYTGNHVPVLYNSKNRSCLYQKMGTNCVLVVWAINRFIIKLYLTRIIQQSKAYQGSSFFIKRSDFNKFPLGPNTFQLQTATSVIFFPHVSTSKLIVFQRYWDFCVPNNLSSSIFACVYDVVCMCALFLGNSPFLRFPRCKQ